MAIETIKIPYKSEKTKNADYRNIRELLALGEDVYIKTKPRFNNDRTDLTVTSVLCSDTKPLARIISIHDDGVVVRPTVEYQHILRDLNSNDRLRISALILQVYPTQVSALGIVIKTEKGDYITL